VILHVPHASRSIPADVRADILLDDEDLSRELLLMTDSHTDVIAESASALAAVRPWQFVNDLSRLVIDPERFPDEREEMLAVGMGAVYTSTAHGGVLRHPTSATEAALIAEFFNPYADNFAAVVDSRLKACGRVTILDIHSFPTTALPYERHADLRRPAVCLGVDPFHTPPWLIECAIERFEEFGEVLFNEPFIGTYVPLEHWGTNSQVASMMVEIRRDTYMDEATGDPVPAAIANLGAALSGLCDVAASS
jgi:N-formylglutamate amidohydrolase